METELHRKSILTRFWSKVIPNLETGCFIWISDIDKKGYGRISIGGRKGKVYFAHRIAWMLANGNIPDNLFVLHKCDNPSCVNINHLYLGTQGNNMSDMHKRKRAKGRQNGFPCGEKHHRYNRSLHWVD